MEPPTTGQESSLQLWEKLFVQLEAAASIGVCCTLISQPLKEKSFAANFSRNKVPKGKSRKMKKRTFVCLNNNNKNKQIKLNERGRFHTEPLPFFFLIQTSNLTFALIFHLSVVFITSEQKFQKCNTSSFLPLHDL